MECWPPCAPPTRTRWYKTLKSQQVYATKRKHKSGLVPLIHRTRMRVAYTRSSLPHRSKHTLNTGHVPAVCREQLLPAPILPRCSCTAHQYKRSPKSAAPQRWWCWWNSPGSDKRWHFVKPFCSFATQERRRRLLACVEWRRNWC